MRVRNSENFASVKLHASRSYRLCFRFIHQPNHSPVVVLCFDIKRSRDQIPRRPIFPVPFVFCSEGLKLSCKTQLTSLDLFISYRSCIQTRTPILAQWLRSVCSSQETQARILHGALRIKSQPFIFSPLADSGSHRSMTGAPGSFSPSPLCSFLCS